MNITLFKEITTEEALRELESDGKKYTGLYVDMADKDQRKYVKDSAAHISGLLKKVDRFRIDSSKDYKAKIESEADAIKTRLEHANAPFSSLIDEHNEKRKIILAKQKAREEAEAAAIQKESDHEFAILQHNDYKRQAEEYKIEKQRLQAENDSRIAEEATARAKAEAQEAADKAKTEAQEAIDKIAKELEEARLNAIKETEEKAKAQQQAIDDKEADRIALIAYEKATERKRVESMAKAVEEEKERMIYDALVKKEELTRRAANKAHCRKINTAAVKAIMKASNCTKEEAMLIVSAISNNEIPCVEMRY